jgi:hypothetical protein
MALANFPNRYGRAFLPISTYKMSATIANNTINAAGESHAGVGRLHLTTGIGTSKTISAGGGGRILWRSGTPVTFADAGTTLRIGIQDLTTGGVEDGTHDVHGELVGGTDPIAASSVIDTDMETGTKTIAHGDYIAIVIEMTARGGSDVVSVGSDADLDTLLPYVTNDTGSGPAKTPSWPMFTIIFDDGTVGWLGEDTFAWSVAANTAFNSGSTPDEYCQLVQYPWDFEATGIVMYLSGIASTDDFEGILYSDPLGTPSAVETVTVDASENFANAAAQACFIHLPFTALRTITRNTRYGIAIRPTTANSVQLMQLSLGDAAVRAVLPLGTNVSLGSRTNQTGAFSETTTLVPVFGLVPASLHDGSGGGGGSTFSAYSG